MIQEQLKATEQTETNKKKLVHYDVVIMGAGFAGVCQARHLLLNNPDLRVALIDPRSSERSDKDLKVGESTVEISSLFMAKELGLQDYLIENHAPKYGLNFYWPKKTNKTDSTDDYFQIWGGHRTPSIDSFQINRAKFETDVLKLVQEMGADFYHGRVTQFELTSGDTEHIIQVKSNDGYIAMSAKHLVDASGRRFLIGKKTENITFNPDELCGIQTGSAWVRVKNIDPKIFDDGYHPLSGTTSRYYCTNHWMGAGHWIWMLPIDRNDKELSIGIVHHKGTIESKQINTIDKFKSFLKENHSILHRLIESGETVDFNYLPRLAHISQEMISQDNWYVIGDAAQMFDPFYSPGLVLTAFAIESNTEVIRAKLKNEKNASEKQEKYNEFLTTNARAFNCIYQKHEKMLGDASTMSWRLYLEIMFYFGLVLPTYIGKWFLDFDYINQFTQATQLIFFEKRSLFKSFYGQLERLVERRTNIGIIDFSRADQLFGNYEPRKLFDNFLQNTKLEPQRCNVYVGIKSTLFYSALLYIKLQLKGFGPLALLNPFHLILVARLLGKSAYVAIGELIYKLKMRNKPNNQSISDRAIEFQDYQYENQLQPW